MLKKGFKGRCEKQSIAKCEDVCRTYHPIQKEYVKVLSLEDEIVTIRCNVLINALEEGDYTSDIVCTKKNGELLVRECVYRNYLTKPKTIQLLNASRNYWLSHGVRDWGIVVEVACDENEVNA